MFGEGGDLACCDLGDLTPSWASCSRKLDHRSASDSFLLLLSGKKSVERDGVLGVRCHGDNGILRLGLDAPGLARPACSRWSSGFSIYKTLKLPPHNLPSDHASKAAIICNIWNFLGSALSSARKWRKWLLISCLVESLKLLIQLKVDTLTYRYFHRACPS